MDKGNWIPLDKRLVSALPKDRPYTILEAAFSLQLDLDCNNLGSVNGYASLWQWSNRKVKKFIDTLVENKEEYPIQMGKGFKNDKVKAQQKHNKSTIKAQKQFRIINKIEDEKHNKSTIKAQQKHYTNNPNPNPNKKTLKTFSSEVVRLTDLHIQLIIENFPAMEKHKRFSEDKEKTRSKWLDSIDKLNRIDKIEFSLIEHVIRSTQKDPFWCKNCLSGEKLRQKFPDFIVRFPVNGNSNYQASKNKYHPYNNKTISELIDLIEKVKADNRIPVLTTGGEAILGQENKIKYLQEVIEWKSKK